MGDEIQKKPYDRRPEKREAYAPCKEGAKVYGEADNEHAKTGRSERAPNDDKPQGKSFHGIATLL
jgi:hypothetical protein